MPSFLIEVPQESDVLAQRRVRESVRSMGSHFATHADWRQKDGGYIGSMIVDTADKWSALAIVPPNMRRHALVSPLKAAAAA
jgi:hypothetical protein